MEKQITFEQICSAIMEQPIHYDITKRGLITKYTLKKYNNMLLNILTILFDSITEQDIPIGYLCLNDMKREYEEEEEGKPNGYKPISGSWIPTKSVKSRYATTKIDNGFYGFTNERDREILRTIIDSSGTTNPASNSDVIRIDNVPIGVSSRQYMDNLSRQYMDNLFGTENIDLTKSNIIMGNSGIGKSKLVEEVTKEYVDNIKKEKEIKYSNSGCTYQNDNNINQWFDHLYLIEFKHLYPNIIIKLLKKDKIKFNIKEFGIFYETLVKGYESNHIEDRILKSDILFLINVTFGMTMNEDSILRYYQYKENVVKNVVKHKVSSYLEGFVYKLSIKYKSIVSINVDRFVFYNPDICQEFLSLDLGYDLSEIEGIFYNQGTYLLLNKDGSIHSSKGLDKQIKKSSNNILNNIVLQE